MNAPHEPRRKSTDNGRIWAGAIVLGLGIILLVNRLDFHWFYFPSWIFSWPMILLVVGLVIGGNSNFKNPASYILIIVGGFFLMNNILDWEMRRYIWPAAIIAIGIWLLSDRNRKGLPPNDPKERSNLYGSDPHNPYAWDKRVKEDPLADTPDGDPEGTPHTAATEEGPAGDKTAYSRTDYSHGFGSSPEFTTDDYIKITSIFADVRRIVISKNFKGGEVVNVFGGSDINLMQADMKHPITIDMFQMFAGTKIIVPAHWTVKSEVTSVFGDVDDRRYVNNRIQYDDNKVLYIRGTSIFGGVTIKSM